MTTTLLTEAAAHVSEAVLNLLWRQWAAIGGAAAAAPASSLVDPELLILTSGALRGAEPRLYTVMEDWLRVGAPLVSTQRLKNLRARFPKEPEETVPRKRSIEKHRIKEVNLLHPAALMLRLRSAFGVSIKADLVAILLGRSSLGHPLTELSAPELSTATHYGTSAVRRALNGLHAAGMIHKRRNTAGTDCYRVNAERWQRLLVITGTYRSIRYQPIAPFRPWVDVLSYAVQFLRWAAESTHQNASDYAIGALWRIMDDAHPGAFEAAGIFVDPHPLGDRTRADCHHRLAEWITTHA